MPYLIVLIYCLSGSTYQVYPVTEIDASLISCTKMYNLYQIPVALIAVDYDNFVQLSWSTPDCKRCEVKGKKCEKSNSSPSGTQCIPTHTKGILSIQFIWRATFKRTQHQTLFTSFSIVKYCFLCFKPTSLIAVFQVASFICFS